MIMTGRSQEQWCEFVRPGDAWKAKAVARRATVDEKSGNAKGKIKFSRKFSRNFASDGGCRRL